MKLRRKLSDALKDHGCDLDADEFRTLLMDVFHGMYRGWTVDRLNIEPDQQKRFCVVIRKAVRRRLPDSLILGTLLNMRKSLGLRVIGAA